MTTNEGSSDARKIDRGGTGGGCPVRLLGLRRGAGVPSPAPTPSRPGSVSRPWRSSRPVSDARCCTGTVPSTASTGGRPRASHSAPRGRALPRHHDRYRRSAGRRAPAHGRADVGELGFEPAVGVATAVIGLTESRPGLRRRLEQARCAAGPPPPSSSPRRTGPDGPGGRTRRRRGGRREHRPAGGRRPAARGVSRA